VLSTVLKQRETQFVKHKHFKGIFAAKKHELTLVDKVVIEVLFYSTIS